MCPRICVLPSCVVSRHILHLHVSRRGRVEQRAVRGLALPSRHEPYDARERRHARHSCGDEDGDPVLLEEALRRAARIIVAAAGDVLRACGVLPAQSRRDKVGVRRGGIRRGKKLNVWSGCGGAAVDKVTVVQQKVHVRY